MSVSEIVAKNLRGLRSERGLSLGRLAELSGVSKVVLSQIERGDSNPTINTLWKIAGGLQVPYTALLGRQRENAQIVKKENIEAQLSEEGHWRLFCYYPNTPERNFELFLMELDEGFAHTSVGHSRNSHEYVVVLEGELTLVVEGEVFVLQADDAVAFCAEGEHAYRNNGRGTVRANIINFYPFG